MAVAAGPPLPPAVHHGLHAQTHGESGQHRPGTTAALHRLLRGRPIARGARSALDQELLHRGLLLRVHALLEVRAHAPRARGVRPHAAELQEADHRPAMDGVVRDHVAVLVHKERRAVALLIKFDLCGEVEAVLVLLDQEAALLGDELRALVERAFRLLEQRLLIGDDELQIRRVDRLHQLIGLFSGLEHHLHGVLVRPARVVRPFGDAELRRQLRRLEEEADVAVGHAVADRAVLAAATHVALDRAVHDRRSEACGVGLLDDRHFVCVCVC